MAGAPARGLTGARPLAPRARLRIGPHHIGTAAPSRAGRGLSRDASGVSGGLRAADRVRRATRGVCSRPGPDGRTPFARTRGSHCYQAITTN